MFLFRLIPILFQADEQQHRYKEMLKICRQVTPQLDISYFMTAIEVEPTKLELSPHTFKPGDISIYTAEVGNSRVTAGSAQALQGHHTFTTRSLKSWQGIGQF